jgi:hypothetical protein
MRKKVYLILLLVSLLALSVGAASPAKNAVAQSNRAQNPTCDEAGTFLVGRLAELPGVLALVQDLCDFRVRLDEINPDAARFDRRFIEQAIASNMLEIQSLQYTLERTENEEWRGLIQMMIAMHTSDLQMALEVAEKIDAETNPDLTNMRVYPQTPEYDLGMRRINLVARFLDPLMSGPDGNTPTPVPTIGTMVTTITGTVVTPTAMGTLTPVFTPTSTATLGVTLQPETSTATTTGTATAASSETTVPTDTGTAITPETTVPTETETAVPTGTLVATGTGTIVPTETGTITPTTIPPIRPDFDLLSLHVIEDEHVMQIEVALVAQRLTEDKEISAFAKHTADMAKLHLLLMNDLKYRLAHNYTLPDPIFEEESQSPRRLDPAADEINE